MNGWRGNDQVFRGYFYGDDSAGSDGKKPRKGEKIKDETGRSFEEVSDEECFGAALNNGWVDISFDSTDMLNAFLNIAEVLNWRCMVLRSKKGGHTYWKKRKGQKEYKDGRDKTLACGLVADIHSGNTYIPLRIFGEDRFPPVYDILDGEDYQEVPDELLPVQTKIKLWRMKYGEGRNDSLFSYILVLQQIGLSDDRIRGMYREVINKYILADPVESSELDVILRDEAFDSQVGESFWDGKTFLHESCGKFMVEHEHIIKINKKLHIYNDGIYVFDTERIEEIIRSYVPVIRRNQKGEVMDYIQDKAQRKAMATRRYIAFANGIYDLESGTLGDFDPNIIITNKIPWDYKPGVYSGLADRTLNNVADDDPEIRALLEECIGYSFYRGAELRKAFILTGDKRNGKSTFLRMLQNVLGEENYTTLDIGDLGGRFAGSGLYGKLANIADDIKDSFFEGAQLSYFKKIVSGDEIYAEYKGKDGFKFKPYSTIIGSANEIPHMRDWTGAALDRLIFIPFTRTFAENDPNYDSELTYKLEDREVMEYLVKIGLEALQRLLKNKHFTESEKVNARIKEYERENDSILAFIDERDPEVDIINNIIKDVYTSYEIFCKDNDLVTISQKKFTRRINAALNTKSSFKNDKNGKTVRCFAK